VVADFRAERNKLKNGASKDVEDDGDGSGEEEGPPKKRRKAKAKAREQQGIVKKVRARKMPRGRGRKAKGTMSSQPAREQEVATEETGTPPALAVKLRPRAKPNFQGQVTAEESDEGQDDDDDDEFVINRQTKL